MKANEISDERKSEEAVTFFIGKPKEKNHYSGALYENPCGLANIPFLFELRRQIDGDRLK